EVAAMPRLRRAALIAAVLALTDAEPARPAAPPPVARDRHGDPLPPGAVARLGTLRYRLSFSRGLGLGFTPDGEKIVAATQEAVEVFEAKTGRRLRFVRLDFNGTSFALSPDGKRAAVGGSRWSPGKDSEGVVRVIGADGKEVRTWVRTKASDASKVAFSADGKLLASLDDGLLRVEEV